MISFVFSLSNSLRAKMSLSGQLSGQLRYETSNRANEIQDCSGDSQVFFLFLLSLWVGVGSLLMAYAKFIVTT